MQLLSTQVQCNYKRGQISNIRRIFYQNRKTAWLMGHGSTHLVLLTVKPRHQGLKKICLASETAKCSTALNATSGRWCPVNLLDIWAWQMTRWVDCLGSNHLQKNAWFFSWFSSLIVRFFLCSIYGAHNTDPACICCHINIAIPCSLVALL